MEENKYLLQYTDEQLSEMEEEGTLQPPTEEELIEEAIRRMELFGYYKDAIRMFKQEGTVLKSECGNMGILYELDEKEQEIVKDFEDKYGYKVYACIKTDYRMSWGDTMSILTCLYVAKYYSEWRLCRADLTEPIDDKGTYETVAYVANLTDRVLSESGYIHIAHTAGGGYQRV